MFYPDCCISSDDEERIPNENLSNLEQPKTAPIYHPILNENQNGIKSGRRSSHTSTSKKSKREPKLHQSINSKMLK